MKRIDLAKKYGTPLYIYDFDHFTNQYRSLKDEFKARKSLIAFAVKSNSNLSVIKHFANLGAGADCVSIGEVRRAIKAGVKPYKIIFSGVGKKDEELREAIELGILFINVESEGELRRVEAIAKELGVVARISLRVNPNIDPKTHPYISTGLNENKFGIDIETSKRLYLNCKTSEHLDPVGIHFHIGSQLTELQPIKEASEIVADLVRSLEKIDIELKFFDVGGGLGVVYEDEVTIPAYDYVQAIMETIKGMDITIICEPGRYLTANGGEFLTTVLYEKMTGDKRFVIVDGAMNDLLRPSLYNAYHEIEVIGKESQDGEKADIVGPVCESGDFLAKNTPLPSCDHGDVIAVKSSGAYGFVMSSNYNTRGKAAEVALEDGKDRIIRKRESIEEIWRLEEDYLK